jgi:hypothetical protein
MGELKTRFNNSWAKPHPIRDDPNLRPLFEQIIEHHRKATCFHGSATTAVKIQGSNSVFGSVYFKRCHGLYVNAWASDLGETCSWKLVDRFEPMIEYWHSPGCLYGPSPKAVVQGTTNIPTSIFFRRCHGVYINALGAHLDLCGRGRGMGPTDEEVIRCSIEIRFIEMHIRAGIFTVEDLARVAWSFNQKWYRRQTDDRASGSGESAI